MVCKWISRLSRTCCHKVCNLISGIDYKIHQSSVSSPPYKPGIPYYIAFSSSLALPKASLVCRSFRSSHVIAVPHERIVAVEKSSTKLTKGSAPNSVSTDYSMMIPLVHQLCSESTCKDFITHAKNQQIGFDLFKKGFSLAVSSGNYKIHSSLYNTLIKTEQLESCQSFTYNVYAVRDEKLQKLIPDSTQQPIDVLRNYVNRNQKEMTLIYSSNQDKVNFCKHIEVMPFGVVDFNIELYDKPVSLIVTVSRNDVIEYVHRPIVLQKLNDGLLGRIGRFLFTKLHALMLNH